MTVTTSFQMEEFRAKATFAADEGIRIATRTTTTLPYRLTVDERFQITKGTTFTLMVTWTEDEDFVDVSSGYTASFNILDAPDGAPILELTEADGISLSSSNRNIIVVIDSDTTGALDFVRGWATLRVNQAGLRVVPLLEGYCDLVS